MLFKKHKFYLTETDLETCCADSNEISFINLNKNVQEIEEDIGLSIVYESISRKEFEDIRRYIHFAENDQLDTNDKFVKFRKLYDIMNKNLQQFKFIYSYYSVDEQMVPYSGKNSSKETI